MASRVKFYDRLYITAAKSAFEEQEDIFLAGELGRMVAGEDLFPDAFDGIVYIATSLQQ